MAIEAEDYAQEEEPGPGPKVYETVPDLASDIQKYEGKSLRLWGQKLKVSPSPVDPRAPVYQLVEAEEDDPEGYVDARIFQIKTGKEGKPGIIFADVFDYERAGAAKKEPWLAVRVILNQANLAKWRQIEVMDESRWQNEMSKKYPKVFNR